MNKNTKEGAKKLFLKRTSVPVDGAAGLRTKSLIKYNKTSAIEEEYFKNSKDLVLPSTVFPLKDAAPKSSTVEQSKKSRELQSNQSPNKSLKLTSITFAKLYQDPLVLQLRKEVDQFNTQFTQNIDNIVNCWLPKLILDLKQFGEGLTNSVEMKMVESVRKELEAKLPVPNTSEQINQLNDLYGNFRWKTEDTKLPPFYEQAYYLVNGPFAENETFCSLYSKIQPWLVEAKNQLWRMEYGIRLLIPTLDDSNNAGVKLQKTIIAEIREMREKVTRFLYEEGWLNYAQERLNYLQNVFTYPQCVDHRLALEHFEQIRFWSFRQNVEDLMMSLLILQNLLLQNMGGIKKPRVDHNLEMAAKILT